MPLVRRSDAPLLTRDDVEITVHDRINDATTEGSIRLPNLSVAVTAPP